MEPLNLGVQPKVFLEDEYYYFELQINALEQHGNLFIEGKVENKFKTSEFSRMVSTKPENRLSLIFKEGLRALPFASWVFDLEESKIIKIPLLDYFNNEEFQAKNLQIEIMDANLLFLDVTLKTKVSIFGIRWIMREYFWTCLLLYSAYVSSCTFFILCIVTYLLYTNVVWLLKVCKKFRAKMGWGKSSKGKKGKKSTKKYKEEEQKKKTNKKQYYPEVGTSASSISFG